MGAEAIAVVGESVVAVRGAVQGETAAQFCTKGTSSYESSVANGGVRSSRAGIGRTGEVLEGYRIASVEVVADVVAVDRCHLSPLIERDEVNIRCGQDWELVYVAVTFC